MIAAAALGQDASSNGGAAASDSTPVPEYSAPTPKPALPSSEKYKDGAFDIQVHRKQGPGAASRREPVSASKTRGAASPSSDISPGLSSKTPGASRISSKDKPAPLSPAASPAATPQGPTPTLQPSPTPSESIFVGVVNNRRLNQVEHRRRVEKLMKFVKVAPNRSEYEEAFYRQEGLVLKDWADRTLLAEEAKNRGLTITDAEFQSRYAALKNLLDDKADLMGALRKLDLNEDALQAEIRESMLGEKLVEIEVAKYRNDEYLMQAYRKAPQAYNRPAQVRAIHYSQALEGFETRAELKGIHDKMKDVRKRIAKGDNPAEIAKEEGGSEMGALGIDLGWIAPEIRSLPLEAQKALADLSPGDTSDILLSKDNEGRPRAFHILKVLEQRPAINSFELAKPIMLEKLHESIRQWLIQQLIKSKRHVVLLNTGGIKPEILEKALKKAEP